MSSRQIICRLQIEILNTQSRSLIVIIWQAPNRTDNHRQDVHLARGFRRLSSPQ